MREFTENEVKPIAAETDRTCEYPRENIEEAVPLRRDGHVRAQGGTAALARTT